MFHKSPTILVFFFFFAFGYKRLVAATTLGVTVSNPTVTRLLPGFCCSRSVACEIGGPSTTKSWPPNRRRRQRRRPPVRLLSTLPPPPPPLLPRLLIVPPRSPLITPTTAPRRGGRRPGLLRARGTAATTLSDSERAARAPCHTIDVAAAYRSSSIIEVLTLYVFIGKLSEPGLVREGGRGCQERALIGQLVCVSFKALIDLML